MKKVLLITILNLTFVISGLTQVVSKSLFFYQDSVLFLGCGVIQAVDILYFVSDTSNKKNKNSEYYIAVKCAETYGEGFFRKNNIYILQLNKEFKKIKPYLPPITLEKFIHQKNFFVAEKVRLQTN